MAKLNTKTSIVDLLKSLGKDSSFSARKKIAVSNGIKNYTGTAAQNIQLIKIVSGQSSTSPKTTTQTKTPTTKTPTTKTPVKTTTTKAPVKTTTPAATKTPTTTPTQTPKVDYSFDLDSVANQNDEINAARDRYKDTENQKIIENNSIYARQKRNVKGSYENAILGTGEDYRLASQENQVQKYINAQEVAENNANLGLTDSGLNRTQQTAVTVSASNNESKIRLQRQKAVDNLTNEMNARLSEIENNRVNSERGIKDYYEQLATQEGMNAYNTKVDIAYREYTGSKETAYNLAMALLDSGEMPSPEILGKADIPETEAQAIVERKKSDKAEAEAKEAKDIAREDAYKLLSEGQMPLEETLTTAGIPLANAQAIVNAYNSSNVLTNQSKAFDLAMSYISAGLPAPQNVLTAAGISAAEAQELAAQVKSGNNSLVDDEPGYTVTQRDDKWRSVGDKVDKNTTTLSKEGKLAEISMYDINYTGTYNEISALLERAGLTMEEYIEYLEK